MASVLTTFMPSILKILKALGHDEGSKVKKWVASFPRWCNLNHFSTIIHITFSDGNKMQDLSKQAFYSVVNILNQRTSTEGYKLLCIISSYLQLDSYIGLDLHTLSTLAAIDAELLVFDSALKDYIECALDSPIIGLKLDWDFPKAHLWKHATRDIHMKGAVCNYSTCPNEKLHGPLKEAYERQSNGKDVADQILHVDRRKFAIKMMRVHMDVLDKRCTLAGEGNDDDEDLNPVAFKGHIKLGSTQQPIAIQDIENHSGQLDRAFQGFHKKFSNFINNSLLMYGYRLERWVTIPTNFLFTMSLPSTGNKLPTTFDALQAFMGNHTMTAHFCQLLDVGSFEFALVQPFTAGIAIPRASSIFVPVQSFIHGAVCFPDPDHQDEFLMVDHIDSDMHHPNTNPPFSDHEQPAEPTPSYTSPKLPSLNQNCSVQISPLSHISNDTAISSAHTKFAELKHKFPSLGTKEDEELLFDKERVAKKPKIEPNHIAGLKICARDSGDLGSLAVTVEGSIGLRNASTSSMQLWSMTSPIRPAHQYVPRPNPNMFWYLSHSMVWTLPSCRLTPSWTGIRLLLHVDFAKAKLNMPHVNSKDIKMLWSNWPCAGSHLYNMEPGNLIVMPQAGDSSDDFTAELNTVEDTESKSGNDEQDNKFNAQSNLDTLRSLDNSSA
ncbi:hypothetical protein DFH29DRAFT_1009672 [Suillus ampliporus]|nr:hypothetical protein DFH29DRAFT_1009672 [Suillus ampliporus]